MGEGMLQTPGVGAKGSAIRSIQRFLGALLISALLVGCGVSSGRQEAPTPTPLPPQPAVEKQTYTAEVGNIVEELQLSGRVAAKREDSLAFAQAGNIAKIHVR